MTRFQIMLRNTKNIHFLKYCEVLPAEARRYIEKQGEDWKEFLEIHGVSPFYYSNDVLEWLERRDTMIVCYADRPDGYNGHTARVKLMLDKGKLYEHHGRGFHMSPVLYMYLFPNAETALWYVKRKSEFYTNVTAEG